MNEQKGQVGETMKETNVKQTWPIILFTIGVFMAGLDNGIISAALTTVYNSFGVSPSWGAWSVTIYTLGVAVSVPIIGKLSDKYGRKRLFIVEVFLFGLGSLAVALSPTFTILLISRFIQAIGGGGIFIIASSYILATLPKKKQGKMLGIIGGMHGLSAIIGPNIGALILRLTGTWEWMFLINIPIAAFLIIMSMRTMQETKADTTSPLDIIGSIYVTIAILAVMYGITNIDGLAFVQSILSVTVFPYVLAGLLLFAYFLRYEKRLEARGGDPIVAYSLLSGRAFQLTMILGFLAGAFLSSIIFIPSYVQQVLHVPAADAGFWLTPLAFASAIGAGLGGVLTDRIGSVRTIIVDGLFGLTGFFTFYVAAQSFTTFLLASILAGIGLGFLLGAPLNVLVGENARGDQYGSALGALSLMRQIGLALFPTIFASFVSGGVMRIEPVVKATVGEDVMAFPPAAEGEGYGEIIAEIERVQDPLMQEQLLDIVRTVMHTGFKQMFFSAIIVSLIVLTISGYLYLRKHQKENG